MSAMIRTLSPWKWNVKRAGTTALKSAVSVQPTRNCYYVLIPEIPDDSPENNNIMQLTELPNYVGLRPHDAYRGIGKRIIEYETNLFRVEKSLEDPNFPRSFEAIFDPIEEASAALNAAWSNLRNLNLVHNEKLIEEAVRGLHNRVRAAFQQTYQQPNIYEAIEAMHKNLDKFQPDQQRVIAKYYRECRNSSSLLPGKTRESLLEISAGIAKHCGIYNTYLEASKNIFIHHVGNDVVKNFPEQALKHFATNNGFVVTLHEPQYSTFMKYCAEPSQRKNLYQAQKIRASKTNNETNNGISTSLIRLNRDDLAKHYGFKNYWEYSLSAKAGPAPEVVSETLYNLSADITPIAKEQLSKLKEFCSEKGFKVPIEQWDLPYWRRRYEDAHLALDEEEVKQVFSVENVLKGFTNFLDKIFGIELRETATDKLWSGDTKLFKVFHQGKEQGSIVFDLNAREDKVYGSYCELLRRRSKATDFNPVTSIIMSLRNRTYVGIDELQELLGHLGRSLQHILSAARYIEVSGVSDTPWHMVNVCPQLFKSCLLDDRFANLMATDMSADLHKKIVQRIQHLRAVDLLQEIYMSILDMELHTRPTTNAQELTEQLQPKILSIFNYHRFEIYQTCSMPEIFTGVYAANYYSKVWSEMVAIDAFEALTEKKDLDDVKKVAKRFCETMLVDSGRIASEEGFRKFRGRDPVVEPFLNICKMK